MTGKPNFKKILRFFFVAAVEFINTTGGIDKFLFAGEEGVAFGADTDFVLTAGGFDVPGCTASASHDRVTVSGMDLFFHYAISLYVDIC